MLQNNSEVNKFSYTFPDSHFKEECGIFGIFASSEAARFTCYGLHALQHRGQESAGIVSSDANRFFVHKGTGLVADIFSESVLSGFKGRSAIGHVRYSTTGESGIRNAQPFIMETVNGSTAIAHNGNITNAVDIRKRFQNKKHTFFTTADSEVILHILTQNEAVSQEQRFNILAEQLQGAYSLLIMTNDSLTAIRDPFGFRPLVMGKRGDALIFASETCALDMIDATYVREIQPGEVVTVNEQGISSFFVQKKEFVKRCIFELIYFSRSDSIVFSNSAYAIRKEFGAELAREHPIKCDVVIPVPDSGTVAAIGYSQAIGVNFEYGLLRSPYIGRTFIEPEQSIRNFGVRLKLSPVANVIKGRSIVVVDDSLVRGTTSIQIIQMLKNMGAKEIHFRIASPPTRFPCFYGIDTLDQKQLIASNMSINKSADFLGCDSLAYLSIEGMKKVILRKFNQYDFCDACFTGKYPDNH